MISLSKRIVNLIYEVETLGGKPEGVTLDYLHQLLAQTGYAIPRAALRKKLYQIYYPAEHIYWQLTAAERDVLFLPIALKEGFASVADLIMQPRIKNLIRFNDKTIPPRILDALGLNVNKRLLCFDYQPRSRKVEHLYTTFGINMPLGAVSRFSLYQSKAKHKVKFGVYDRQVRKVRVWVDDEAAAQALLKQYQGNYSFGF